MILEIEKLSKVYCQGKGQQSILTLDKIQLSVQSGEFVSLIGPSGCGKSTLFNIISGLELPDEGKVLLDGVDITGKKGYTSYMMQKDLLLPWRTVLENCLLGMEIEKTPPKIARERARSLLAEFGLLTYENSFPNILSGGMRQRVAFLRTMLAGKKLLLLDEPFGALDAYTKREMHNWLLKVWEKYRVTILFITHDIEEALLLSDRVYVMTHRPASIKGKFNVLLPRPRLQSILVTGEFLQLKKELLSLAYDK